MSNAILALANCLAFCISICVFAEEASEAKRQYDVPLETSAILMADQADNRIRLYDPRADDTAKSTLWCYPPDDQPPLHYKPTDAKRVKHDGVVYVLAAYHGRVRLVRFHDQELIKDYPSYSSCHSAALLPDGVIVTANSNHGMLRLHRSQDDYSDLELPYAHGVSWDQQHNCLWAVGDFLYRIDYSDGELIVDEKFALPSSPTGHDLFPMREQAKLLVSNNDALFVFDIATEKFSTISELHHIKSASQHADGSIWVSDPRDIAGAASWQSDSLLRVQPNAAEKRYTRETSRFYKARWWQ
ncbi:DUF6528 family protein [Roseimaritima ulvae]|uniref:NHL repeat protein n=1 Tax=Roseimaritima ulvae TaxID=980254 RepID=A0A5B9QR62_9BACT|nr:DUF6528 family protein [Roseimaritima ulvae]QEG41484.1 hypothetical protein UC8_35070 [Roseimaritima ulvae]